MDTSLKLKRSISKGFTLLEILIALFIFSIVSLILASSLKSILNVYTRTEEQAKRIRDIQLTLLMMSRDIKQTVNRPILNASGKEDAALIGTSHTVTLTHGGYASTTLARSEWQRVSYTWQNEVIWRKIWPVLDSVPSTKTVDRALLKQVIEIQYQYLDHAGLFHSAWPLNNENTETLPRAIKVDIQLKHGEVITQLYVIPAEDKSQHSRKISSP